jgi:hypothetical protein
MSPKTHFNRFGAAYIRGTLYAIIAFLAAFNAEFDGLKELPSDRLATLTWMFWVLAWSKILGATAVTMRAFFDGTMERIAPQPPSPASISPAAAQPPVTTAT